MHLQRGLPIRSGVWWLGLCLCVPGGAASLQGQNGTAPAPSQQENPFPGEPEKNSQKPADNPAAQQPAKPGTDPKATPPKADTAKPKTESDNPFPGEDSKAPIIPVTPGPGSTPGSPGRPAYTPAQRDGDSRSSS